VPGRILVVDDDLVALRMMRLSLESEGFQVSTASSAFEALRVIQTEQPDLIVLDVMMPDMDGVQMLRHLRSQPTTSDVPVIFLTAKSQLDDKIAGLRAGADDYITKPADPREVTARVQTLMLRSKRTPAVKQGRVVAVIGAKGGVGTSTIALNLAVALARRQTPTVLIDLRPNAGTLAWQLKSPVRSSLADLVALPVDQLDGRRIEKSLAVHPSGLRLLSSPPSSANLSELPAASVGALVRGASALADVIFLDLPHLISPASREALRCSNEALLILGTDPVAVACAEQALSLLEGCGLAGEAVALIIVNRAPMVAALSIGEIERKLQKTCLGMIPSAPEELAASERQGAPLALSTAQTMATMALQELIERVRTRILTRDSAVR